MREISAFILSTVVWLGAGRYSEWCRLALLSDSDADMMLLTTVATHSDVVGARGNAIDCNLFTKDSHNESTHPPADRLHVKE